MTSLQQTPTPEKNFYLMKDKRKSNPEKRYYLAKDKESRYRSIEETSNFPLPDYVIDRRAERNKVSFVSGEVGSRKSFVLVNWASETANEGKRVLCLITEASRNFWWRMRAWERYQKHRGLFQSHATLFTVKDEESITMREESASDLKKLKSGEDKFDLIVIDSFIQFAYPYSMDKDQDMILVMDELEAIAKNCNAAVVCSHFTDYGEMEMEGSSVIRDRAAIINHVSDIPVSDFEKYFTTTKTEELY